MDEAMISLLETRDFEYITVREICRKAEVNRSTFYLHYENTRELLDEAVAYLHEKFQSYFNIDSADFASSMSGRLQDDLYFITPEYLIPYLEFIRDHRRTYIAAVRNPSVFRAEDTYRRMFENIFSPILSRFSVPVRSREYIMAFYLNGIAAIVARWIENDCADEISEIIGVITACIPEDGCR